MQPTDKTRRAVRPRPVSLASIADLGPDARIKIKQIIGDPTAEPPVPGILPVSQPTLYRLIKKKCFPAPTKLYPGSNSSFWRLGDVLDALRAMEAGNDSSDR